MKMQAEFNIESETLTTKVKQLEADNENLHQGPHLTREIESSALTTYWSESTYSSRSF